MPDEKGNRDDGEQRRDDGPAATQEIAPNSADGKADAEVGSSARSRLPRFPALKVHREEKEITIGRNPSRKQVVRKPRYFEPELKYALPSDTLTLDKHMEALRNYGASSSPEHEGVGVADMAKRLDVSVRTVELANEFFISVGFIVEEGGRFRPGQHVVDFSSAFQNKEESPAFNLAPQLLETWFGQHAASHLLIEAMSRERLVRELSIKANSIEANRHRVEMLIDLLGVAGVVVMKGDDLDLTNRVDSASIKHRSEEGAPSDFRGSDDGDAAVVRFSFQVPGRKEATIIMSQDMSKEDWEMLRGMINLYFRQPHSGKPNAEPHEAS